MRNGGSATLLFITETGQPQPQTKPSYNAKALQLLREFPDTYESITQCPSQQFEMSNLLQLEPNHKPPYRRPFRLSLQEKIEVDRQVADLLQKGLIEPCASPFGAPVLFVLKRDGTLRMCVDYRALNKQTIRDRYPLPRIDDLLDKLHGKAIFSSLDLQSGYHQISIPEQDRTKTAFVTHSGQYQYKVMPFGLTNAPSAFQRVMNDVFHDMIKEGFVLIYLDDILVVSSSEEEHQRHLRAVLSRLRDKQLKIKLSKCELFQPQLKFLGHIISAAGIAVDPEKVKAIIDWPLPTMLKQLQAFLGLANYFRRFIRGYSTLAAPLTNLTRKCAMQNQWEDDQVAAFEAIKLALVTAPVLALPDLSKPFTLLSDASLHGTGGILTQEGRVVAFTSAKFSPAEYNYSTGEQELLAILRACQIWRCYLEGPFTTVVLTDHRPLTHILTQQQMSRRVTRWVEFLQRFKLDIQYLPGKHNPADALSRHPRFATAHSLVHRIRPNPTRKGTLLARVLTRRQSASTRNGCSAGSSHPSGGHRADVCEHGPQASQSTIHRSTTATPRGAQATVVRPPSCHEVEPVCLTPELQSARPGDTCVEPADRGSSQPADNSANLLTDVRILTQLDERFKDSRFVRQMTFDESSGVYRLNGQVVLPSSPELRQRVISLCHDHLWAGHPGIGKTYEWLKRYFYWPHMLDDVTRYVNTCDTCQKSKSGNMAPAGLLCPLPIPGRRWEHVSVDLAVAFPISQEGYDSILVFVDRLTKMVHLVPTNQRLSAARFARLFMDNIIRLHGKPSAIVSDRGPQFASHFWQSVCYMLDIKHSLSTAYHPQSDGQTERTIRTVQQVLRSYIKLDQRDWPRYLAYVEFVLKNSRHESTRQTPFYMNYGEQMPMPHLQKITDRYPAALDFVQNVQQSIQDARKSLEAAQQRMKRRIDEHRRFVEYNPGDLVLLNTQNLQYSGCKKFKPKWVGPFKVDQHIGDVAVRLHLPEEWRIHNTFHISLVKPYLPRSQREANVGIDPPFPTQFDTEGEPIFEVESILAHRQVAFGRKRRNRPRPTRLEFRIRWRGYTPDEDTWEPESNLTHCKDALADYWDRNNASSLDVSEMQA